MGAGEVQPFEDAGSVWEPKDREVAPQRIETTRGPVRLRAQIFRRNSAGSLLKGC